jgi:hypothetical protein
MNETEKKVSAILWDAGRHDPRYIAADKKYVEILTSPALINETEKVCREIGFKEGKSWETIPSWQKQSLAKELLIPKAHEQNVLLATRGSGIIPTEIAENLNIDTLKASTYSKGADSELLKDFTEAHNSRETVYSELTKLFPSDEPKLLSKEGLKALETAKHITLKPEELSLLQSFAKDNSIDWTPAISTIANEITPPKISITHEHIIPPQDEAYLPKNNETQAFSSINDLNGNAVVDPISDAIEHSAIGTNYNAYVAEDTATLVNKLAEQHQPSWRSKLTPAWLKSKSNANEINALTQKIYESDASLHLLNDLAKVKEFKFSAAKTYPKQREILGKAMRAIHEGSPLSEDELNHLNGFLETPVTAKSLKEMHATFITSTEAHHSKFREIVADHKLKYNIETSIKPSKEIAAVTPSEKLEPAIQDIKFNEAMEFSGGIKLNETVGFNGGVKLNEGLEFGNGIKTAKSSKEWKNPLNKAGDWVKSKQWWPSKEDWRGLWPFGKKNAPVTNQELSEIKAVETNWISENKGKAALIGAGVIAAGGWVAHTMKSDKPEHRNR